MSQSFEAAERKVRKPGQVEFFTCATEYCTGRVGICESCNYFYSSCGCGSEFVMCKCGDMKAGEEA